MLQQLALIVLCCCVVRGKRHHSFEETLLLRPLEDGNLLAHYQFDSSDSKDASHADHFVAFPKSLGQILNKFDVQELHLSFTQGRWNHAKWGYPLPIKIDRKNPAELLPVPGPAGAEMWSWIKGANSSEVDEKWQKLQQGLAGIYCASLHQIGTLHTSNPTLSFPQKGQQASEHELRYGTLPRENVCTENLTPWLKLLPCRNKAGLGSIIHAHSTFDVEFHTLAVSFKRIMVADGTEMWHLRQSLDLVLNPRVLDRKSLPHWSLHSLFGKGPASACPIASYSAIHVHLNKWMKVKFPTSWNSYAKTHKSPYADTSHTFKITPKASKVTETADDLVLDYYLSSSKPLALAMTYPNEPSKPENFAALTSKNSVFSTDESFISKPPVSFYKYLTGKGQHHGQLNVEIHNSHETRSFVVNFFDSIPWFLKLYFHTLRVYSNEQRLDIQTDFGGTFRFLPAQYRGSPAVIEFRQTLPPLSVTRLVVHFEKTFLSMNEYPPDVNRGFDIMSGLLTIVSPTNDTESVRLYSDGMLVLLPSPDFSMPFNVIAFTCTVMAFFFGSIFNMVYNSDEEILKRGESTVLSRFKERAGKLANCKRAIGNKCKKKTAGRERSVSASASASS